MARTMTDEQERDIRKLVSVFDETPADSNEAALLAELDAERAAHEATKAEQVRVMQRMGNRTGGSLAFGRIRVLEEELAALKARLALAEAVCDRLASGRVEPLKIAAELSAWRAAK